MVNIPLLRNDWTLISDATTTIQLKTQAGCVVYLAESTTKPSFVPDDTSNVVILPSIDLYDFTYVDKSLWAYTSYVNANITKDI